MKTEMFPSNLYIKRYVCVLGKVYAVGGHDGNEHLGSMEVFDPLTNKWVMKASMNTRRCVSCDPKFLSCSLIHRLLLMLKNIMCVLPLFMFPNYAIFRNFFFSCLGALCYQTTLFTSKHKSALCTCIHHVFAETQSCAWHTRSILVQSCITPLSRERSWLIIAVMFILWLSSVALVPFFFFLRGLASGAESSSAPAVLTFWYLGPFCYAQLLWFEQERR